MWAPVNNRKFGDSNCHYNDNIFSRHKLSADMSKREANVDKAVSSVDSEQCIYPRPHELSTQSEVAKHGMPSNWKQQHKLIFNSDSLNKSSVSSLTDSCSSVHYSLGKRQLFGCNTDLADSTKSTLLGSSKVSSSCNDATNIFSRHFTKTTATQNNTNGLIIRNPMATETKMSFIELNNKRLNMAEKTLQTNMRLTVDKQNSSKAGIFSGLMSTQKTPGFVASKNGVRMRLSYSSKRKSISSTVKPIQLKLDVSNMESPLADLNLSTVQLGGSMFNQHAQNNHRQSGAHHPKNVSKSSRVSVTRRMLMLRDELNDNESEVDDKENINESSIHSDHVEKMKLPTNNKNRTSHLPLPKFTDIRCKEVKEQPIPTYTAVSTAEVNTNKQVYSNKYGTKASTMKKQISHRHSSIPTKSSTAAHKNLLIHTEKMRSDKKLLPNLLLSVQKARGLEDTRKEIGTNTANSQENFDSMHLEPQLLIHVSNISQDASTNTTLKWINPRHLKPEWLAEIEEFERQQAELDAAAQTLAQQTANRRRKMIADGMIQFPHLKSFKDSLPVKQSGQLLSAAWGSPLSVTIEETSDNTKKFENEKDNAQHLYKSKDIRNGAMDSNTAKGTEVVTNSGKTTDFNKVKNTVSFEPKSIVNKASQRHRDILVSISDTVEKFEQHEQCCNDNEATSSFSFMAPMLIDQHLPKTPITRSRSRALSRITSHCPSPFTSWSIGQSEIATPHSIKDMAGLRQATHDQYKSLYL